jgi:hypothetical protein
MTRKRRASKASVSAPSTDPNLETRQRVADAAEWAREWGLHLPQPIERFIFWWKHFGFKQGLALFTVVILPIVNTQWTSTLAGHLVDSAGEYYGVQIDVGGWSGAWLGAHATAHDVVISVPGPFARAEAFRADEVSIDLSLFRRLRSGYWITSVTVDRPSLYLERTLSGTWNWEGVLGSDPGGARARAASTRIEHLALKDLRVEWVERLPANSGGGLVQTATATLHLDDVQVNVSRLGAMDGETPFSFEGRTADGLVSVSGRSFNRPTDPATSISMRLENVGAAALGRLSPNARLIPASGSVTGRVELAVSPDRIDCQADLVLRNVTYVLNPFAPIRPEPRQRVQASLAGLTLNGPAAAPCRGSDSNEQYRLMPAVQASITDAALREASPDVRILAAADVQQMRDGEEVGDLSDALQRSLADAVGHLIGGRAGDLATHALADPRARDAAKPAGNAVTRGLKNVGGGIKRLFGGGDDKRANKKK